MVNYEILHPEILGSLAELGHGSGILIADGNYPLKNGALQNVKRVYLNFAPGLLSVPDILKYIVKAVPIEAAAAPVPEDGTEPPIFPEYKSILPKEIEIQKLQRFDFYKAVKSEDTALVIASGETRIYACILLTLGVRPF